MDTEMWTYLLGAASAIVLLANAAEKIAKIVRAAKAPGEQEDARWKEWEEWRKGVDTKLSNDKKHLDNIDDGNRASQRALLALLYHHKDGNNITQMQNAKEELQNHLINR